MKRECILEEKRTICRTYQLPTGKDWRNRYLFFGMILLSRRRVAQQLLLSETDYSDTCIKLPIFPWWRLCVGEPAEGRGSFPEDPFRDRMNDEPSCLYN
jgi:hypothetical protein